MANTVLSRLNTASDEVVASLEAFQELIASADKDHRKEFIEAAGAGSIVAKQALGSFFDQNVGTEGFKDSAVKFFKELLDKMIAYYNRIREFVISHVGVSVKRIDRMKDKIKKNEKYKDLEDIGMTMAGLYGMGYETEEKSLAYMFLDAPPDRMLYTKFNHLKEISDSISHVIMGGIDPDDTVSRIRSAKETIIKAVMTNPVIIKPKVSDDANMHEKKLSFSDQAAKVLFNEKLNPKEVEIKVNAKAFVNGIDGWAKLLGNSKDLLASSKRSSDIVKTALDNLKAADGQSFASAFNEFNSLMSMNVVYTSYIMAAIDNYINTTFKVMTAISRHLGISVVRFGTEDLKEDLTGDLTSAQKLHKSIVRDTAFLDEDNQFFASLERSWDDSEAEDAEYTFTPRKTESSSSSEKEKEGFLAKAKEFLIKLWERVKSISIAIVDKVLKFVTYRGVAVRMYESKVAKLQTVKIPKDFTYTVPDKYNGFSVIAHDGTMQAGEVKDVIQFAKEFVTVIASNTKNGFNHTTGNKRYVGPYSGAMTAGSHFVTKVSKLKGIGINENADRWNDLGIHVSIANTDPHPIDQSAVYTFYRSEKSGSIGSAYNHFLSQTQSESKKISALIKNLDKKINSSKHFNKSEIETMKDAVNEFTVAVKNINQATKYATLCFDGALHFVNSCLAAGSNASTESLAEELEDNNIEVVNFNNDCDEFIKSITVIEEEDQETGLEALLLEDKRASVSKKDKTIWQKFVEFIKSMWEKIVATTKNLAKRIMDFIYPIEARAAVIAAKAAGIKKITLPEKMDYTITPDSSKHTMVDIHGDIIHKDVSRRVAMAIMLENAVQSVLNEVSDDKTGKRFNGRIFFVDPNFQLNKNHKVVAYIDEMTNTYRDTGADLVVKDFVVDEDVAKEGKTPFYKFPTMSITSNIDQSRIVTISKTSILEYANKVTSKESVALLIATAKAITSDISKTISKMDKASQKFAKELEKGAFADVEEAKRDARHFTSLTTSSLQLINFIISLYSGVMVSNEQLIKHIYANRIKKNIMGMGKEDHCDSDVDDEMLEKEMDEWMLVPTSESEYEQDDKEYALVSQGVEDYEDPEVEEESSSKNIKETWEAVLKVGKDKERFIQQEIINALRIVDVCSAELAAAKTKEVSGTLVFDIPAHVYADSPYFEGAKDTGEVAVSERLKVIQDVAYDLCQLLDADIKVMSAKTSIQEAIPALDKLTQDITEDFVAIADTYKDNVGIAAIKREYGIPLLTVEPSKQGRALEVPVETYNATNSANITNLVNNLKNAVSAIQNACDVCADVSDVAQKHVIEVNNISEENTKVLRASAGDYADAMVALTALIHAVKCSATATAFYLGKRNEMAAGPSQESYEKLNYLKNYITASLESGGLMACEIPAINMMSGFLSDAFGLEDFEMDECLFYERYDREMASKLYLDKLTTV